MKHTFALFMLFALGATELTAKPASSRKSKMSKKGARKSHKVSPRKKKPLAKKSGKKPKSKGKSKGRTLSQSQGSSPATSSTPSSSSSVTSAPPFGPALGNPLGNPVDNSQSNLLEEGPTSYDQQSGPSYQRAVIETKDNNTSNDRDNYIRKTNVDNYNQIALSGSDWDVDALKDDAKQLQLQLKQEQQKRKEVQERLEAEAEAKKKDDAEAAARIAEEKRQAEEAEAAKKKADEEAKRQAAEAAKRLRKLLEKGDIFFESKAADFLREIGQNGLQSFLKDVFKNNSYFDNFQSLDSWKKQVLKKFEGVEENKHRENISALQHFFALALCPNVDLKEVFCKIQQTIENNTSFKNDESKNKCQNYANKTSEIFFDNFIDILLYCSAYYCKDIPNPVDTVKVRELQNKKLTLDVRIVQDFKKETTDLEIKSLIPDSIIKQIEKNHLNKQVKKLKKQYYLMYLFRTATEELVSQHNNSTISSGLFSENFFQFISQDMPINNANNNLNDIKWPFHYRTFFSYYYQTVATNISDNEKKSDFLKNIRPLCFLLSFGHDESRKNKELNDFVKNLDNVREKTTENNEDLYDQDIITDHFVKRLFSYFALRCAQNSIRFLVEQSAYCTIDDVGLKNPLSLLGNQKNISKNTKEVKISTDSLDDIKDNVSKWFPDYFKNVKSMGKPVLGPINKLKKPDDSEKRLKEAKDYFQEYINKEKIQAIIQSQSTEDEDYTSPLAWAQDGINKIVIRNSGIAINSQGQSMFKENCGALALFGSHTSLEELAIAVAKNKEPFYRYLSTVEEGKKNKNKIIEQIREKIKLWTKYKENSSNEKNLLYKESQEPEARIKTLENFSDFIQNEKGESSETLSFWFDKYLKNSNKTFKESDIGLAWLLAPDPHGSPPRDHCGTFLQYEADDRAYFSAVASLGRSSILFYNTIDIDNPANNYLFDFFPSLDEKGDVRDRVTFLFREPGHFVLIAPNGYVDKESTKSIQQTYDDGDPSQSSLFNLADFPCELFENIAKMEINRSNDDYQKIIRTVLAKKKNTKPLSSLTQAHGSNSGNAINREFFSIMNKYGDWRSSINNNENFVYYWQISDQSFNPIPMLSGAQTYLSQFDGTFGYGPNDVSPISWAPAEQLLASSFVKSTQSKRELMGIPKLNWFDEIQTLEFLQTHGKWSKAPNSPFWQCPYYWQNTDQNLSTLNLTSDLIIHLSQFQGEVSQNEDAWFPQVNLRSPEELDFYQKIVNVSQQKLNALQNQWNPSQTSTYPQYNQSSNQYNNQQNKQYKQQSQHSSSHPVAPSNSKVSSGLTFKPPSPGR